SSSSLPCRVAGPLPALLDIDPSLEHVRMHRRTRLQSPRPRFGHFAPCSLQAPAVVAAVGNHHCTLGTLAVGQLSWTLDCEMYSCPCSEDLAPLAFAFRGRPASLRLTVGA